MDQMLWKIISKSGLQMTLVLSLLLLLIPESLLARSDIYIPKINPRISFMDSTYGKSDCLTTGNITHYNKCSAAGELERQALYRSPFFGLLMVYEKIHDLTEQIKMIIDNNSATTEDYEDLAGIEDDIFYHTYNIRINNFLREPSNPPTARLGWTYYEEKNPDLISKKKDQYSNIRSCYHLKIKIIDTLRSMRKRDELPHTYGGHLNISNTKWFSPIERKIILDLIGYTPKWWEHTDLGFACELFVKEVKDLLDINEGMNGGRRGIRGSFRYSGNAHKNHNFAALKERINKNKTSLEKIITALKKVLAVEILEARAQFNGPLGKICSPYTDQHYVTGDIGDPASPAWHRLFSSAVLDTNQSPTNTHPVHNILSSTHPSENFTSDEVKKHLMTKDPRYITFYSSTTPNSQEGYHPGLPMIFVPGTDYVPPAILSGGITVYAYPPAVCTKNTDSHRPIRIFN